MAKYHLKCGSCGFALPSDVMLFFCPKCGSRRVVRGKISPVA